MAEGIFGGIDRKVRRAAGATLIAGLSIAALGGCDMGEGGYGQYPERCDSGDDTGVETRTRTVNGQFDPNDALDVLDYARETYGLMDDAADEGVFHPDPDRLDQYGEIVCKNGEDQLVFTPPGLEASRRMAADDYYAEARRADLLDGLG